MLRPLCCAVSTWRAQVWVKPKELVEAEEQIKKGETPKVVEVRLHSHIESRRQLGRDW